ncbi:hypothetical protein [Flavonifractor sp. An100]|uniref:hypothetical protein n=1 Tax=Flavonifractor sp. An100 TaxID=1965538 RepID=UPI0013021977|nr:hypothetical protein [Flavonifractor sp. An100]
MARGMAAATAAAFLPAAAAAIRTANARFPAFFRFVHVSCGGTYDDHQDSAYQ